MDTPELSPLQKRILDFEQRWWKFAGHKEQAIDEEFGLTVVRYHQLLTDTLNHPEAVAYSPSLVKRLNRIKQARAQTRHTTQDD